MIIAVNATRITVDSRHDFATTRARFDERVPLLDPALALELIATNADWRKVEAAVNQRVGPTSFVALSRLDQGALMSLHGEPVEATQYLVGNPVIALTMVVRQRAAVLFAPFPVAVYADGEGTHVTYLQPSSLLGTLQSASIDQVARKLDTSIAITVEETCRRP
jgi:hypothetical protein